MKKLLSLFKKQPKEESLYQEVQEPVLDDSVVAIAEPELAKLEDAPPIPLKPVSRLEAKLREVLSRSDSEVSEESLKRVKYLLIASLAIVGVSIGLVVVMLFKDKLPSNQQVVAAPPAPVVVPATATPPQKQEEPVAPSQTAPAPAPAPVGTVKETAAPSSTMEQEPIPPSPAQVSAPAPVVPVQPAPAAVPAVPVAKPAEVVSAPVAYKGEGENKLGSNRELAVSLGRDSGSLSGGGGLSSSDISDVPVKSDVKALTVEVLKAPEGVVVGGGAVKQLKPIPARLAPHISRCVGDLTHYTQYLNKPCTAGYCEDLKRLYKSKLDQKLEKCNALIVESVK